MLNLRETWGKSTQDECRDLVYVMSQEVGVDMDSKRLSGFEPVRTTSLVFDPGQLASGWRKTLLDRT